MPRFTSPFDPFDGAQLFYRDYQPNKTEVEKTKASAGIHPRLANAFADVRPAKVNSIDALPLTDVIDYNVFAQDTAHLLEKLDIGPFIFVAASMGPGETLLAYERSEFVRSNCMGFFWVGPALPFPLATPENPTAPSREFSFAFAIRPIIQADDIRVHNSADLKTLLQRLMPLLLSDAFRLLQALDLTDRLQKLGTNADVPIMCVHGDQDLGCPYEASSKVIKEIIPRTNVKSVTTNQALTHTVRTNHSAFVFLHETIDSLSFADLSYL
ncbi:hypothetical protein ACO22_06351 [Paracoccidioides brasiliensis]|uniref:Serine aminopeptidase S33 domain-containing protein n=1 Tax=Paracoccidioides brasiliensis TaxID=121759 RepID=A0A1D2J7P6_PARBR|nr:hypothetical protein ACO22_06351 [Paracoccidioides brasiliensis]